MDSHYDVRLHLIVYVIISIYTCMDGTKFSELAFESDLVHEQGNHE